MEHTITPDKQSVEVCLKGKNYYIDFYQREYVWSKQTTETLLNDIFYMFELGYNEHKNSEVSNEIIGKYNWYYLNVYITNKIQSKTYIVDGQQRLSTLTLIATKLYHLSKQYNNLENLSTMLAQCIYSNDGFETSYNLDSQKRFRIMEALFGGESFESQYENITEETLHKRYKDISKYLEDKFDNSSDSSDKKLRSFILYFLKRLVLVELAIDQNDTPMIFEVINDRGEALKPFEILKGKLIGALNKDDTEYFCEIWEKSLKKLPKREDEFFSNLIKSKFVFKRNSDIEKSINQSYHRYIFEDNSIAQGLGFKESGNAYNIPKIKNFIEKEIQYYAKLYDNICKSDDEFLKYLNINELTGQYQIILAACEIDDENEDEKIKSIAREYERLWLLLHLNGIYDSNEFQGISYGLNERLKNAAINEYKDIFDSILKDTFKETRQADKIHSLLEYEIFITKDYANTNKRLLRYLFARIEKYLCEQIKIDPQNDIEYITTKTGDKTGYHIEHILSRNTTNIEYFSNEEEFNSQRNILGGLLLLKDKTNIKSSNEEYEDKLKTYSNSLTWGHTLCQSFYHKTNQYFLDFNNWLNNNKGVSFKPYDTFNETALKERSKLLYELIKIIWNVDR